MSNNNADGPARRRPAASFLRQLVQRPLSLVGAVLVLIFLLLTVFGSILAPYPFDQIIRGTDVGLESRRALTRQPPSADFPLGTDQRGRDILSRMLYGARETIGLPLVATLLAVVIGGSIGLAIGYLGGTLDDVVSRLLDSIISIPVMVLALVMISTIVPTLADAGGPLVAWLGAGNISLAIVVIIVYVPIIARVTRSATLSVRSAGYIEEARLRGESTFYILFSEIFPSVLPALVVEVSLRLSYAIILVASLGFLGLGVQPPSPEWGRMVLDARPRMMQEPWELWAPVLALAVLIVSLNLMSDGFRRILRADSRE